jgi:hypothetical protein
MAQYLPTGGNIWNHGAVNEKLVCSHCGERGAVHTKPVSLKKGVSGGKAVAGLMTGGLSLFATGLSRKERVTEAWCGNCESLWHF